MGAWGRGLFDNDSALDIHHDMTESLTLDASPAHLAAGIGLHLWLGGHIFAENLVEYITRHADWVAAFPPVVRDVLRDIEGHPEAVADWDEARPKELSAILGDYCAGPHVEALVRCQGSDVVIAALADRCRKHLDEAIGGWTDLYGLPGDLGPLGILLELHELGVRVPATTLAQWEAAFDRADRNTDAEREFWDDYVARVKAAFALLRR